MPASSGLACWTWGWSSGTRSKGEWKDRRLGWINSDSISYVDPDLIHTTLGVMQKPAQGRSIWLFGYMENQKCRSKSLPDSYSMSAQTANAP